MGKIIVKVPEDVEEVIELEVPYSVVKEKLEEIKTSQSTKEFVEFILKNTGRLKEEDLPTEEEIYLQGD